ncbi:MAG: hypothetical protein U0821_14065 [Chloroflexota bacterium]
MLPAPPARRIAALAAAATLALALSLSAFAVPAARALAAADYLIAADPTAERLYFYRLPDLAPLGQLDNLKLGAHAGAFTLPDGGVVFVDDRAVQFVVVRPDASGVPSIAMRAPIPTPTPFGRAAWGGLDPSQRYLAVSSDDDGAARQTISVLDTTTGAVSQILLELKANLNGQYEEVHAYIGGNPSTLFATVGGEVRGYLLDDVLAGRARSDAPSSAVTITPNSHGPAFSHALGRLYSTTADGLATADVIGGKLYRSRTIPWSSDGPRLGQNFRPRLSYDGSYLYGAVTGPTAGLAPTDWAQIQGYFHAVDLRSETSTAIPLGSGIMVRFALSQSYALIPNLAADGDSALLVDVLDGSPSFQQMIGRVPLAKLSDGPVAGEPTRGKQSRAATITPDGRWGFVSHGGDGKISVIDTAERRVASTIDVPSTMAGGGYLYAVQPGSRPADLALR